MFLILGGFIKATFQIYNSCCKIHSLYHSEYFLDSTDQITIYSANTKLFCLFFYAMVDLAAFGNFANIRCVHRLKNAFFSKHLFQNKAPKHFCRLFLFLEHCALLSLRIMYFGSLMCICGESHLEKKLVIFINDLMVCPPHHSRVIETILHTTT